MTTCVRFGGSFDRVRYIPQEVCDVNVVGERGTQSDDADHGLRGLYLPECSRDDGFDDGATFVVEQMHLVDDEQFHFLHSSSRSTQRRTEIGTKIMRPTDASSPSPVGFRVTTSHFSGVVTMICVSAISFFVSCISPTR